MIRLRFVKKGGHIHIRVFAGPHEWALGKCGDLVMRPEEWDEFRLSLKDRVSVKHESEV